MIHKSVLLEEAVENLNLKPGMTVVDGTLGAGGHSIAIFKKIIPGGKLISIDRDARTLENFSKKLGKEGYETKDRIRSAPVTSNANGGKISPSAFVPVFSGEKIVGYWRGADDNFANLDNIVRGLPDVMSGVDAIFVDLGFSSDQILDAKRGFSFSKNGPLDMRYSPETQTMTAEDVVNEYAEKDLADIFKEYGEEKFARRIAGEIGERRKIREIRESGDLVGIISRAIPESHKRGKIHFATRTFQALRIEVNGELENLKIFLEKAVDILAGGGRLAVMSFHSLEDRIVKQYFRKESRDCVCPPKYPKCVCRHKARLKIITKKPIIASERETRENPRARSAKLRVAEKIT